MLTERTGIKNSNISLGGAHRSYHALYDAAKPSAIPFNSASLSSLIVESSRFLSLPVKRNEKLRDQSNLNILQTVARNIKRAISPARISNSSTGSALNSRRSQSASPVSRNTQDLESESLALDFKRHLIPILIRTPPRNEIDAITTPEVPVLQLNLTTNANQSRQLRKAPIYSVPEQKRAVLNLPSSSQWANLNALRVHAGSPERSEEGIEKLA
ncbi:hypothetical protein HK100_000288, partial [Physocladia obscura]